MSSIVLIIQIILALLMLYHAVPKLIFSKEKLKSRGGKEIEYVDDLSQINLIVIGIIEFLTSLGLIIPELLNDFTWIIILSSSTIIVAMLLAVVLHLKRDDGAKAIFINFLYIFMSFIVLFGNQFK
jgi:cytochrome bd-type quinol oxidase subunit 2